MTDKAMPGGDHKSQKSKMKSFRLANPAKADVNRQSLKQLFPDRRSKDRRLFDRRLFSPLIRDGFTGEDRRIQDRRTQGRRTNVDSQRQTPDRRWVERRLHNIPIEHERRVVDRRSESRWQ